MSRRKRCAALAAAVSLAACSDDAPPSDTGAPDADATLPDADVGADADASDTGRDALDVLDIGPEDTAQPAPFDLRVPASAPPGVRIPVAVFAGGVDAPDASVSGFVALTQDGLSLLPGDVPLRRGVGVGAFEWDDTAGAIRVGSATARVEVNTSTPIVAPSVIAQDTTWPAGAVVHVDDALRIDAGATLRIEPGVWVLLGEDVDVSVAGGLDVAGTTAQPVVFAPRTADWGGVALEEDASADIRFAFLTGGGAGDAHFGHSNSQPVLFGRAATVSLADVVIHDAPGKAMGARYGSWTVTRSIVTRTDTGGEFEYAALDLSDSYFFDFPELDPTPRDDDNDGIYLLGDPNAADPPQITIRDTTFISGADDGVDHNGSVVDIRGSWIEGFDNECIATSSGGSVTVHDTVLRGCAQGLEAGYGRPAVSATHLLVTECGAGIRLGDGYEDSHDGTLDVRDSVVFANTEFAVRNWVFDGAWGPADGQLTVTRSVIDTDEADADAGNVVATPVIGDDGLLQQDSPGAGIAEGGADPGLVTPRYLGISNR